MASVLVESVTTKSVRNLADATVSLGPGINLVWGSNGAGKTNLLESVYLALAGRSCRTRDDRELIRFGESLARVEATVMTTVPPASSASPPGAAGSAERTGGARSRRTFLASASRAEGRRHLVDGSAAGAQSAALRPALAVFMPDRLALVKGAPALRRSHLDGFCAALWPARDEHRRRYARALAQRNALLGRIRAGAAGESSLDAWDAELAAAGIDLIALRAEAAGRLSEPFSAAAEALGLERDATLGYRPRSAAEDAETLVAELAERRPSDLRRGYSGWGPHLDELALEIGGRSTRRYASQGQQRVSLLALLFAERRVLLDDGRPAPLMLLDDVTSELDARRRELLVAQLSGGQSLITATEPGHLPEVRGGGRTEIALRDGRALAAAEAA